MNWPVGLMPNGINGGGQLISIDRPLVDFCNTITPAPDIALGCRRFPAEIVHLPIDLADLRRDVFKCARYPLLRAAVQIGYKRR